MSTYRARGLTRRDFLKMAGAGLAAAGMSPLLGACAPKATATPAGVALPSGQTLKFWWWGETEAPGLEKWVAETAGLYKAKSGNSIESTLMDTLVVISEFQTASAAKAAPDNIFLWNGIYHMESVWLGYLDPMEDFFSAEEIAATRPTKLSVYQGKTYRLGWYSAGPLYLYNKDMFDQAGLDGNTAPKTWDELLTACDKLKTKGFTPIVGGLKDGPWGEWYMGHGLGQNLDTPADAINLFIGALDWREPRYYEHWSKLKELWDLGFINADINSIDLYPGIDLFGASKGAMTAIVTPILGKQETLMGGSEKIGLMTFPVFGVGKMAGKPIADCQGIGISSQSKNKEVAADFLRFVHDPERVKALWNLSKAIPNDASFDTGLIEDPVTRELRSRWVEGDNVPYISNLMPGVFWTDAMFVNSQKIITGEFTGEQAGQNAYDVTLKWKEQNPDLVEKYSLWAKDLAV
jgi:raffinose/stachyose/melibiose transport system substrate-binding protein